MKSLIPILFLLLCSCKNDLEVIQPGKTLPIIYGLVSPQDSVYRIRLTRSFLAEGDIETVARNPDSLYFYNADVRLQLRTADGGIIGEKEMKLTQIEDKTDGLFVTHPNYIYQCNPFDVSFKDLPAGAEFNLIVEVPDADSTASAQSKIPEEPELLSALGLLTKSTVNLFHFTRNVVLIKHVREFYTEFELIFRYSEYRLDSWVPKEFVYTRKIMPGEPQYYPEGQPLWRREYPDSIYLDEAFMYPLISNRINEDPEVTSRQFKEIELRVFNADAEFANYYYAGQYLTDYNNQNYSNIINGLGLFASYWTMTYPAMNLNNQSMDSLCSGRFTKNLKFRNWE